MFSSFFSNSQSLIGSITSKSNSSIPFANISIKGTSNGVSADEYGSFNISNLSNGYYTFSISAIGFISKERIIEINGVTRIDFKLEESSFKTDEIVVTGTRTFKRKTETPVIVNVLTNETLNKVQACNLSEALKYQPGLRVETDCQTCNYTQLRMNGLSGGYSQILINGRAIFSPLTGLYGMEQIPTNMIDRIEVVRGGGSSLYGSSAIGGTVNVITKVPNSNSFTFSTNYLNINNSANDNILSINATIVSENKNFGSSIFLYNRDRDWYDHNSDNFSELPKIKDKSFGATFYYLPSEDSKFEVNIGSIYEYRYGGEMIIGAPHFSMQSEERVHDVFIANADYMKKFSDNFSLITYVAMQQTDRLHYTGIRPEISSLDDIIHLENPPYGISDNNTKQVGLQIDIKNFFFFFSVLTGGSEFL